MERDKITTVLEDVGAVVLANACGPCIGQVHCSLLDNECQYSYTRLGSGNARTPKRVQTVCYIFLPEIYADAFKAILTSFNR
jgi:hypothetical protein